MAQLHRQDLAIPVASIDHLRGAPDGRITIVEYGDFECPTCRSLEPGIRKLLDHYPDDLRLVYRHFPISSAHPHALLAAEAAEAAGAESKFWAMHDLLIAEGARLDRTTLNRNAQALGLDMAQFTAALNDEIYRQRVHEHIEGATHSHLRAAPGLFVNGHACDATGGMAALHSAVKRQLHFLGPLGALHAHAIWRDEGPRA
jgi:protein-disulfide isomerase